jgi:predicted protein tyrosine phosphatase
VKQRGRARIPEGAVAVVGRSGAGKVLCSPRRCSEYAFLVSIGGPREREPAGYENVATRVRLVFEDAPSQAQGGPSLDDIERLVAFARRIDFAQGKLLVHCQAGISRSSAAAIIVLARVLGPGHEQMAVDFVQRTHPHVRPNRRMLALADTILETGGRLLAALDGGLR